MCGIAGSINCITEKSKLSLIAHRGPDHQALVELELGSNKVYLGHTRLSILDLSEAGNQPMFSECGKYCIIFNGEIYNHPELRKKLTGINFKGHSDTETILYYISRFGINAVKDFNGIFAFAFMDIKNEKIFLVRDHFGVKPLYYYRKADKLIFASELKMILANKEYVKGLNLDAVNTFLTLRYNPSPQTLFEGIHKLEPAHYLEYDLKTGESSLHNYWCSVPVVNTAIKEPEAIEQYKFLLEQAVKRQLLSDVPVGLLLSGGVDSAVLGYLMAKNNSQTINTFTIGFNGEGDYNELADAKETAALLGSKHFELFVEQKEYLDFFYKSFYHTEEPIAEPTISALYYVSKLASQHLKVVLSGQGADEPMAGYKRYIGEKFLTDYRWLFSLAPRGLVSALFPGNSALDRAFYASKFSNEMDRFIGIYTLFTPELKKGLYKKQLSGLIEADQKFLFRRNYENTGSLQDSLSKLLYLDTRTMLPDDLLLFNDKIAMANSLENRVPYLDLDLVNFIETLPLSYKLRGKKGKYIHKKAAESWLPPSIINRKKRGFLTPIDEWLKGDISSLLTDLIDSPDSLSNLYFNKEFIKEMLIKHKTKKKDYQRQLFIILSLELWYKHFYNTNFSD